MPRTKAQENRAIRQEALRQQLQAQGHLQHVVDLLDKVGDPEEVITPDMLNRYQIVIGNKLKLVNKYLPDLKSAEVTGEGGGAIESESKLDLSKASAEQLRAIAALATDES